MTAGEAPLGAPGEVPLTAPGEAPLLAPGAVEPRPTAPGEAGPVLATLSGAPPSGVFATGVAELACVRLSSVDLPNPNSQIKPLKTTTSVTAPEISAAANSVWPRDERSGGFCHAAGCPCGAP